MGFSLQKPRRQYRKRLMMLPASPMAHFIVGQTGFALAALEAFFDAMGGFGYPGQFPPRRLRRSVGQIITLQRHLTHGFSPTLLLDVVVAHCVRPTWGPI